MLFLKKYRPSYFNEETLIRQTLTKTQYYSFLIIANSQPYRYVWVTKNAKIIVYENCFEFLLKT
jgi:hypothetical protein